MVAGPRADCMSRAVCVGARVRRFTLAQRRFRAARPLALAAWLFAQSGLAQPAESGRGDAGSAPGDAGSAPGDAGSASGDAGSAPGDAGMQPLSADAVGPSEPARDRPPRWLHPAPLSWPVGGEGGRPVEVLVLVSVDGRGFVRDAVLPPQEGEVPPALAETALVFARQQRFVPALRGGAPSAARVQLRIPLSPSQTSTPRTAPGEATPPAATHGDGADVEYGAEARIAGDAGESPPATASDLHLELGALHQVPRPDAAHLLTLSPGVVLTNHAGEGHAWNVFLRGFDAGEGQDFEVRVAGMPINEPSNAHGHGYADTGFVIPELVASVHVLQGPFDPRQGDFAAAGSADFELAAQEPGIRAQVGVGSFGRRRLLLAWSPPAAGRATFAAVDLEQGDGFGPNRAHGHVRTLGQLVGRGHGFDFRVLVASHALRFDTAGVVRADAVRDEAVRCAGSSVEPFFCLLDPHQGGHASRHLVSARLGAQRSGRAWSQQATLMLRESRYRSNFTGALLDPRGDGLDQQTETVTLVLSGHYRLRESIHDLPQTLELGYEGRHDRGASRSLRLRSDGQTPYDSLFDHDLSLTRVSAYVRAELTLQAWLSAQLGARADSFGYLIRDRDRESRDLDGERLPQQTIDAWGTNLQPRATLTVGPFRGHSWVSSFGIGSRSSDAAALSAGERAPFTRIWAGESGLLSRLRARSVVAEARAALYYAYVDRDLLFDETRGRNVPIGATNRYGAHGHVRLRAGERVDSMASFSWAEAYQTPDGGPSLAQGVRLPFVPRFVARGDAAFSDTLTLWSERIAWRAGAGLTWVGPRPLPLDTLSNAIFSLDASVRARVRFVELALSASNLTDRRNRSAEYFYPSDFGTGSTTMRRERHFSAAPPRLFMATVGLVFERAVAEEETP